MAQVLQNTKNLIIFLCYFAISFPEPMCLLVSTKTRVLVLTKSQVRTGNEICYFEEDGKETYKQRLMHVDNPVLLITSLVW